MGASIADLSLSLCIPILYVDAFTPPPRHAPSTSSAIQRWLSVADTSPVTGVHLRTLELYDCRAMRETVEEFRQRNDALRRKAAAIVNKGVFSRPGQ